MFTFHHKSTVLDISNYDCLAFVNPEESESDIYIEKIYVDTTYPVQLFIASTDADFDGYKENDLSDFIKSNVINKRVLSGAKMYGHPYVSGELETVKEVLVDEPMNVVEKEDGYVLRPGNALIFRVKAKAENTEVNFAINYLEN